MCRAVLSAGLGPLDGGSTSGNFLQPSQWGWVRAKPWGLWGGPREAHPPLRQYHFEAHHPSPAGSCETSPPPSHSRTPRQIHAFPASLTSPRASVSVIWRDGVRRNGASPRHTASPQLTPWGWAWAIHQISGTKPYLQLSARAPRSCMLPSQEKPTAHERRAPSL